MSRRFWAAGLVTVMVAGVPTAAFAQGNAPQLPSRSQSDAQPQASATADSEISTVDQGPLHEAFAAPVNLVPEPTELVREAPPERIDELPPSFKPEGRNIQWIPGYWAYTTATRGMSNDARQNASSEGEFIWVSGVWRDVPQGRQWVEGFWAQAEDANGYRWNPGFWATEDYDPAAVTYLPQPPRSLEEGPSSPAPSDSHFWIPGQWEYRNNDYSWRAGYWYQTQPNFVWTPATYCYTTRGYVYVPGYWDYPVANRGLVFAPVRFSYRSNQRVVYNGRFTPSRYLNPTILTTSLYVAPSRNFYAFGNFGLNNGLNGFVPLSRANQLRGVYDPVGVGLAFRNGRRDPGWRDDFERRNLERVQDFQNSDLADGTRLLRDVSTLSNGGSIGDIIVNRINDEAREQFVDRRLNQLDRRDTRQQQLQGQRSTDVNRSATTRESAKPVVGADGNVEIPGNDNGVSVEAGANTDASTSRPNVGRQMRRSIEQTTDAATDAVDDATNAAGRAVENATERASEAAAEAVGEANRAVEGAAAGAGAAAGTDASGSAEASGNGNVDASGAMNRLRDNLRGSEAGASSAADIRARIRAGQQIRTGEAGASANTDAAQSENAGQVENDRQRRPQDIGSVPGNLGSPAQDLGSQAQDAATQTNESIRQRMQRMQRSGDNQSIRNRVQGEANRQGETNAPRPGSLVPGQQRPDLQQRSQQRQQLQQRLEGLQRQGDLQRRGTIDRQPPRRGTIDGLPSQPANRGLNPGSINRQRLPNAVPGATPSTRNMIRGRSVNGAAGQTRSPAQGAANAAGKAIEAGAASGLLD